MGMGQGLPPMGIRLRTADRSPGPVTPSHRRSLLNVANPSDTRIRGLEQI
ncbi:MAG: hypothetical protein QOE54_5443 [Streptosporangiaceae bacterium]|nr:hypothetical protein [Streptosporangiaceae bacterium]